MPLLEVTTTISDAGLRFRLKFQSSTQNSHLKLLSILYSILSFID